MASPQRRSDENPKIYRERLRENGVDYFLKWETMGPPPDHINKLREALTDTSCSLSSRFIHNSAGAMVINPDLSTLSDESRELIHKRLAQYRTIVEDAEHLCGNIADENDWRGFYKINFLEPLFCKYQLKELDSRSTSQTKFYFDYFERREDLQWTLFSREGPYLDRRRNLKYPKPDWSAYFPICNLEHPSAPGFTKKPLWNWRSRTANMIHDFDAKELREFSELGLQCHVAGALHRKTKVAGLDPKKMQSFPWFIVEFKSTKGDAPFCYCQAANGAACGLLMYETLSQHANKEEEEAQIPPIITMTTVGKEVKLWIGYAGPNKEPRAAQRQDKHRNWFHSRCFWEGDMTKIKDAMDLEALLENIHTWAVRVLRPRIIQSLKEWRLRVDSRDRDLFPKPLAAEQKQHDSQDVRLSSQEMDTRLRTMLVSFQDDTMDMMEKLLLKFTADLRSQIQNDESLQTGICRRMDAETQIYPSPIYEVSLIETSSETNGSSPDISQSDVARTSKSCERMTRVDSSLDSAQMRPGLQAGVTEVDCKSNGKVQKPSARISQKRTGLVNQDPLVFNNKTFRATPYLSGGTRTAPPCSTASTDQGKDKPRPTLQYSASAVSDSRSPPSSWDSGHLARSDNYSVRALSMGDLHQTHALQDPIRPKAQISPAMTPFKGAFHQKEDDNKQFEFTFKI